ncbi:MAG: sugar nucleotide-binding protein [Candidatus Rokubacteria bacterium]|nr:sugar nucleotide-binding protein [Candidatus Rokubacteria bacterium]
MSGGTRRVLVLGASSFIGRRLFARLGADAAYGTYAHRPVPGGVRFDAETMDLAAVIERPAELSHAVLLLGNTNPDACARDLAGSRRLNVTAIAQIVDRLAEWGVMPVFLSTEAVFDGRRGRYVESDVVGPLMAYAAQKVEIERHLATRGPGLVVRLARVYGSARGDGTLFTGWLEQAERGEAIRCASDNVLSPIHVDDVVATLLTLIRGGHTGTFHVAGEEPRTRLALLETLLAEYGRRRASAARAIPCRLADFATLEPRPRDISLDPAKAIAATGVRPRTVVTACREIVDAWCAEAVPA